MLSNQLLSWYSSNKRDLPWRLTKDPYKIWISEIMLQQTQVATVIPYYKKWMSSYPDIKTLACADYDNVLKHWEGLGYYSRCKNIHLTAKSLGKDFPDTFNELIKLPGIGEYTAKTILAIAYNKQEVGVDTNLERVGFRLLGLKRKSKFNRNRVKKFLETNQDKSKPGDFNQALMDLGSSFCQAKVVHCSPCPITSECKATLNADPLKYPEPQKNKPIPNINVSVCIVCYRDRLLILQRPQNKMLSGLWEFPGGKIEPGESPEAAAIREIKEETNLSILSPDYIGEVKHQYSHFKVTISLFLKNVNSIKMLKIKENYVWTTMKGLDKFALPKANYKMLELLNK
ncbi:MAG: A/G-specific adenine glycosylase [Candidatus Marinimicrobia bacterium]|nr:A/G-specific adenine glycosylase [Candidatus Neomarinimicrobiota bacterium]